MKRLNIFSIIVLTFFYISKGWSQIKETSSQLIENVQLIDGKGNPAFAASVRIQKDKIIAIGTLSPLPNEKVINGEGWVLAPGFIDTHSHHLNNLRNYPEGIPATNQGITTIVIGQDGNSIPMDTLKQYFKQNKFAINVATYTGHTTLREIVMGENNLLRAANKIEIAQMQKLLESDLRKGSLGLSTGLEYEPAFYSSKEEVMQLARVTAKNKGRYISHIRSEDVQFKDALEEIIQIGRATKMPVQISHIKLGNKDDWGKAAAVLQQLNTARAEGIQITADVYPYTYWNSTLKVLFPSRDYNDMKSATLAVEKLMDPAGSVLVKFLPIPSYEGKTILAIAAENHESPAACLIRLIALSDRYRKEHPEENGGVEAIAGKAMSEADVAQFIQWPYANICSDGNAGAHPRGHGAFTRVLGMYVRENKLMSLETAIHKMTAMSADHVGIQKRGTIEVGNYADLVLLDPATVKDQATLQNSKALSTGIKKVWVNGTLVYDNMQATYQYPGMLIQKQ